MSTRALRLALASAFAVALAFAFARPAARADAPPGRPELAKLLAETDAIAATVSKLRGLPVKRPLVRSVVTREQVTRRVLERMDEEKSAQEILAEQRAFQRLGLLPAEFDYKKLVLDLLTEQIAGFYDPKPKALYLADWLPVETQKMVMAHEIDHALQDQSFDLLAFLLAEEKNADATLARQALVEGDGVALMIEYIIAQLAPDAVAAIWAEPAIVDTMSAQLSSQQGGAELARAPRVVREALLFPYLDGLRFVAAARRTGAWSVIDAMFARPPASTEQILHPEKYVTGEAPHALAARKLPALVGHTPLWENVMGELMVRVLLEEHGVSADTARKAAAGWGGDRLQVLAPAPGKDSGAPTDLVAVWWTSWDTEQDAGEAQAALSSAARTFASSRSKVNEGAYAPYRDATGDVTFVERRGTRIVVVFGAPPDAVKKLRADAWRAPRTRR